MHSLQGKGLGSQHFPFSDAWAAEDSYEAIIKNNNNKTLLEGWARLSAAPFQLVSAKMPVFSYMFHRFVKVFRHCWVQHSSILSELGS